MLVVGPSSGSKMGIAGRRLIAHQRWVSLATQLRLWAASVLRDVQLMLERNRLRMTTLLSLIDRVTQ